MLTTSKCGAVHSCDMDFLRSCFSLTDERKHLYASMGATSLLESMEKKAEAWAPLCDYAELHGVLGMVLRNADSTQWCVITPDPDPGFYRYTGFDRRGFYMHGQYRKPEEALLEVFRMGFRIIDSPDVMDSLLSSSDWVAS